MVKFLALGLVLAGLSSTAGYCQNAKPSYEGAPDVCKVIFEDQDFRVIEAAWKARTIDKAHTHPVPSVIYNITGCTLKLRNADGKTVEVTAKPGTAGPVPLVIQPHTAENPSA